MAENRLAIFASGSGTNAEEFFRYFNHHPFIKIVALLSNNPDAFALKRADNQGIPINVFSKNSFYKSDETLKYLRIKEISHIVLAGFMWLVPENIINGYKNRIYNIHPALLPKYGGKGMYGDIVHRAVIENGESYSGITIHYVNNKFDEGKIIFQEKCPVLHDDKPESLAVRIHQLEYAHYPRVIEEVISGKIQ